MTGPRWELLSEWDSLTTEQRIEVCARFISTAYVQAQHALDSVRLIRSWHNDKHPSNELVPPEVKVRPLPEWTQREVTNLDRIARWLDEHAGALTDAIGQTDVSLPGDECAHGRELPGCDECARLEAVTGDPAYPDRPEYPGFERIEDAERAARATVEALMEDIRGRSGLGDIFEGIDGEVRGSIEAAWYAIVMEGMSGQ